MQGCGSIRNVTCVIALIAAAAGPAAWGASLRFFGTGQNDIDRVKIRIDAPARPADIGSASFTVEFFLRALPGENPATSCREGNDGWIYGHVIIDRDVYGGGDFGDYGISLFDDGLAFGVAVGGSGEGICARRALADGQWHHVAAVRRASDGTMALFVDGVLEASAIGPVGNVSYRDGRATIWPNDPFLVFGAEKHDAGSEYPSFSGWLDEVRLSNVVRYSASFAPPTAPFVTDASTMALYHFDEGAGTVVNDASGASGGPSQGVLAVGGSPAGPLWSIETPFAPASSGPGRIPGSRGVAGPPLVVTRDAANPARVVLAWSASCGAATDYAIYEGPIGPTSAFDAVLCSTGGALTAEVEPAAGARAFVVVPLDAAREGSYGATWDATERPRAAVPCRAAQSLSACP